MKIKENAALVMIAGLLFLAVLVALLCVYVAAHTSKSAEIIPASQLAQ
jgi:hypothetical protein